MHPGWLESVHDKTRLVIILMDDAIKYTCIWPHGIISISPTIHRHLFSDFSPFHLPVKEKEKQWRMKGLTMAQWIHLNQNNRSVLACRLFCVLRINWPYPTTASGSYRSLVGLTAGRQADKMRIDFEIFKILYRLNYSHFYFDVTAILLQC